MNIFFRSIIILLVFFPHSQLSNAAIYQCGNIFQDKPCGGKGVSQTEIKSESEKKILVAMAILENPNSQLKLNAIASRAALNSTTYQIMVKEVGAEKTKFLVQQEINKLLPNYEKQYNNLAAQILAETLTKESLESIKNTGYKIPHAGDKSVLEVENAKIASQKVDILLVDMLTKALGSAFSKIVPKGNTPTSVKKADWLKILKPVETNYHCTNSLISKDFKGTKSECLTKVEGLFDKCAYQVANVQIPEVLASQKEAEKNGTLLGECIVAYYFGGEQLKLFNTLQEKSQKQNSRRTSSG